MVASPRSKKSQDKSQVQTSSTTQSGAKIKLMLLGEDGKEHEHVFVIPQLDIKTEADLTLMANNIESCLSDIGKEVVKSLSTQKKQLSVKANNDLKKKK